MPPVPEPRDLVPFARATVRDHVRRAIRIAYIDAAADHPPTPQDLTDAVCDALDDRKVSASLALLAGVSIAPTLMRVAVEPTSPAASTIPAIELTLRPLEPRDVHRPCVLAAEAPPHVVERLMLCQGARVRVTVVDDGAAVAEKVEARPGPPLTHMSDGALRRLAEFVMGDDGAAGPEPRPEARP